MVEEGMYQVEVKQRVVSLAFPPSAGWKVTVDIDAMERAHGGSHPEDKPIRAQGALEALQDLGATFGQHDLYGRVDIVADHPEMGRRLLEVEGDSSKQPEQAMYSALGQILLIWNGYNDKLRYGIAVPNTRVWRKQLAKIRMPARRVLGLELYLVGRDDVIILSAIEEVPQVRAS